MGHIKSSCFYGIINCVTHSFPARTDREGSRGELLRDDVCPGLPCSPAPESMTNLTCSSSRGGNPPPKCPLTQLLHTHFSWLILVGVQWQSPSLDHQEALDDVFNSTAFPDIIPVQSLIPILRLLENNPVFYHGWIHTGITLREGKSLIHTNLKL